MFDIFYYNIFSTIVSCDSVDFAPNISTIKGSLLSYETAYNGKSVDNISDVMERSVSVITGTCDTVVNIETADCILPFIAIQSLNF